VLRPVSPHNPSRSNTAFIPTPQTKLEVPAYHNRSFDYGDRMASKVDGFEEDHIYPNAKGLALVVSSIPNDFPLRSRSAAVGDCTNTASVRVIDPDAEGTGRARQ